MHDNNNPVLTNLSLPQIHLKYLLETDSHEDFDSMCKFVQESLFKGPQSMVRLSKIRKPQLNNH